MELKEIKKIANYARKSGIKFISFGDLKIEFKDEIIFQRERKPRLVPRSEEKFIPASPPLPTLDQINDFIYGQNEEVG